MNETNDALPGIARTSSLRDWNKLLQDKTSLLMRPGLHHKALVMGAHELQRALVINCDELSDLLEQADGALAYAVEALLDEPESE